MNTATQPMLNILNSIKAISDNQAAVLIKITNLQQDNALRETIKNSTFRNFASVCSHNSGGVWHTTLDCDIVVDCDICLCPYIKDIFK